MNDILKVPILGVTKEVDVYEKEIINYLKNSLLKFNSNIELVDVSFYDSETNSLNNAMDIIEELNKKVIFLTDAAIGNTVEYERVAKVMFEKGIRPFVFATHIESANYDLKEVAMRPTVLVEYFDPRADWYHYIYDSLLFNYSTKKYYKTEDGEEENIDIFIDAIKAYLKEK